MAKGRELIPKIRRGLEDFLIKEEGLAPSRAVLGLGMVAGAVAAVPAVAPKHTSSTTVSYDESTHRIIGKHRSHSSHSSHSRGTWRPGFCTITGSGGGCGSNCGCTGVCTCDCTSTVPPCKCQTTCNSVCSTTCSPVHPDRYCVCEEHVPCGWTTAICYFVFPWEKEFIEEHWPVKVVEY